jgi:Flp pilus assembly protein TadB
MRGGEAAMSRARENPTLLGVAGVVAAGAVAYGAFALIRGARERQKPVKRLQRGVSQVRAELSEKVTEGVETSLRQLERALPHGVLLKLEPEDGGYVRVSDARLEPPPKVQKTRNQSSVLKKFIWAAFVSIFMAVGSVVARRVADTAWQAMVHEEPPTEKSKAAS